MQLVNGTGFQLAANEATDVNGQVFMVAIIKATYSFPAANGEPIQIADEQTPIFYADVYDGEPGKSSPVFESDWAFRKHRCDVVVNASAHAPDKITTELEVGFRVGDCEKQAKVFGPRTWLSGLSGLKLSPPEPFSNVRINYDNSYGGMWHFPDNDQYECFPANPVGRGFAGSFRDKLLDTVGPSVEPIATANAGPEQQPWGFGPLGRNWESRSKFAGTYDEPWRKSRFPLLPDDFDEQFFQCVPVDQQIEFPTGGESVELLNLSSKASSIRFNLPASLEMPTVVMTSDRIQHPLQPVVDTISIDVESETISLVWRAQMPLKRTLKEVEMLAAGKVCKKWWKAQVYGGADCGCGGQETSEDQLISVDEVMQNEA